MKKQDLLRIKAAVIAVALALSLNACTKKASGKPIKKKKIRVLRFFKVIMKDLMFIQIVIIANMPLL